MPLARIEVCRHWDETTRAQLMHELTLAVAEAFEVAAASTKVVFVEHPRSAFAVPDGASDRFTIIQLDMYPGRSVQMKRDLLAALLRRFARFSISKDDLYLVMRELPKENWGVGGSLAIDRGA